MAFAEVGSLGATGSSGNNQATLVLTTSAAAAVGTLAVVVIADDNIGSGADADGNEVASVADSSGVENVWRKAIGWTNTLGGAQAGAHVSIWFCQVQDAIANGGTITATFTNSGTSDATAMTARNFSIAAGFTAEIEGTPGTLSNDAADPGSLDVTTSNVECLRIRGIGGEVGNNTSLTPTSTWTAWANGNSATTGTTAEMCARAEHLISTGTGAASDPTWVACDNASAYVAFREVQATNQRRIVHRSQAPHRAAYH